LEGASWAWLRLHGSFSAEMTCRTIKASQVGQSCCVAVVASCAVVAVVLVKLFGLWVPGADFAFVFAFRVQHAVTYRRTVVAHGTFSCSVISFRTEVAWLAACTFVHLFCCCDYTLSFEWTIHRPVIAFGTVVTSRALFAGWVRLDSVVVFGAEVTSCAVICNQVRSAIVGCCADSAVCVCRIEVSARWT